MRLHAVGILADGVQCALNAELGTTPGEPHMTRKNQGEGDKDSARRFNDKETQFVKRGDAATRTVAMLL